VRNSDVQREAFGNCPDVTMKESFEGLSAKINAESTIALKEIWNQNHTQRRNSRDFLKTILLFTKDKTSSILETERNFKSTIWLRIRIKLAK
jgi:hypothetical protein